MSNETLASRKHQALLEMRRLLLDKSRTVQRADLLQIIEKVL